MNTEPRYDYLSASRRLVRAVLAGDRDAAVAELRAAPDARQLAYEVAGDAANLFAEPTVYVMGTSPEAYARAVARYDAEMMPGRVAA